MELIAVMLIYNYRVERSWTIL